MLNFLKELAEEYSDYLSELSNMAQDGMSTLISHVKGGIGK